MNNTEKKIIEDHYKTYGLDITQFLSIAEAWPHLLVWDNDKINSYLRKCPFCGGKAEIIDYQYDNGIAYAIQCTECESETDEYDNRVEAILKWNQRV